MMSSPQASSSANELTQTEYSLSSTQNSHQRHRHRVVQQSTIPTPLPTQQYQEQPLKINAKCHWRSFNQEVLALGGLAIPSMIVQLSFVVPPAQVAASVGRHFGSLHLDGYTLAWGVGNLSTMALLQGIFNACDTLLPQAFGTDHHREMGLVAMRGWAATCLVTVPINVLLLLGTTSHSHSSLAQWLHSRLGQDSQAAEYAGQFYAIYVWAFPFYSLYSILWKFLAAQSVMMPMVASTLFSTVVLLPLLLEGLIPALGFQGAALAFPIFYFLNSMIVLLWLRWKRPHYKQTWPGLGAWREALQWSNFRAFMALGVGGMLAYLEWAYWEGLTIITGTFGVLPLSAHTIPRQVTDIGYIVPLGIGLALAIRLGATISRNVRRAEAMAVGTLILSSIFFGLVSVLMFLSRDFIIVLFTNEMQVIQLCHDIWLSACMYFFFSSLFGINLGISIGLGMQWTFGAVTVICMWMIGMPATYFFAVLNEGGLTAVWACIWPPYLLINISMCTIFSLKDWELISVKIKTEQISKADVLQKKQSDVESLGLLDEPSKTIFNENKNNQLSHKTT